MRKPKLQIRYIKKGIYLFDDNLKAFEQKKIKRDAEYSALECTSNNKLSDL